MSPDFTQRFKPWRLTLASGYITAVLEQLPKADLVLDHFHLVKWFNEKLSLLRRRDQRMFGITMELSGGCKPSAASRWFGRTIRFPRLSL